jgi:predicted nucleic acid-binding protein
VIVVIDASVILKWLLQDPEREPEPDTDKATALLEAVIRAEAEMLQPIHWLAEVAAVLARSSPQTAAEDVHMLAAMEFSTIDDPTVMRRATMLAIDTGQHVFDTLYHAVALEHEDAVLITADDKYRAKASAHGRITSLRDWAASVR